MLVAVYLHDVGRSDQSGHHDLNSYDMIRKNPTNFFLYEPFVPDAVSEICAAHAPEELWPIRIPDRIWHRGSFQKTD